MQDTLESELTKRIFIHQTGILGGYLMNKYIENEANKGGVQLPDFIIKMKASEHADEVMKEAMQNGTFINMYEEAWQHISQVLPENFTVL